MKKTFNFGKIDFNGTGRKSYPVSIEVELRNTPEGPEFAACGTIWNTKHTDCVCGGQCLDTIAKYVHAPEFKEIYRLWKAYHLNSMNAGTPAQTAAIEAWEAAGNKYDYTKACRYLKSIDLLVDKSYQYDYPEGSKYAELGGYTYGTAWLYRAIPEGDLNIIRELLK